MGKLLRTIHSLPGKGGRGCRSMDFRVDWHVLGVPGHSLWLELYTQAWWDRPGETGWGHFIGILEGNTTEIERV